MSGDSTLTSEELEAIRARAADAALETECGAVAAASLARLKALSSSQVVSLATEGDNLRKLMLEDSARRWVRRKRFPR